MMKRLAGLLAGAALIGGLALANQGSPPSSSTSGTGSSSTGVGGPSGTGTSGTGGSGPSTGQVPGVASGQITDSTGSQLIGTVVESKSHTLYLQHMGVVVPLRVDKATKLEGLSGKKLTDLKSGEEVQVTFQVKNRIENVATRISLPAATGGSGLGASEESRDESGIGGSGTAVPGEDTNVGRPGRPLYPEEGPMEQPMDTSREHHSDQEKPIY